MLSWEKKGLIFRPNSSLAWSKTHASLPTVLKRQGSLARVYYASRDDKNRSHVGWFDTDLDQPGSIIGQATKPVLEPGPIGTFDDHGVYAASIVRDGDRVLMYTIGWNPGLEAPLFYSSIGLAVSTNNGETFEKFGSGPLLGRSSVDLCFVSAPLVLKERTLWRMWYISGLRWERDPKTTKLHSVYHIKYATSKDGIEWLRDGTVCLDAEDPNEKNISRFCVIPVERGYEAWFSSDKGEGYRLGSAFSSNGVNWTRKPVPSELAHSTGDWDSHAFAYPCVMEHGRHKFMFYNGNSFGKDGIGLAISKI